MIRTLFIAAVACGLAACGQSHEGQVKSTPQLANNYFDNTGRTEEDILSGGVRMVPITTPYGDFHVWTKRIGNNPTMKVLILHGGPGFNHEYLEGFDSIFPGAGVEYYYYDQLGSSYSDQPDDDRLWTMERFVDEVEQVRIALGLNKDNFCILGQSWGGMLGMEYALAHQENLKCLIISNMMSSGIAYNAYAADVLEKEFDPDVLAEIKAIEAAGDYENPRYEELLMENFYNKHVLRMPLDQWPNGVMRSFQHANKHIYTLMQGPSELGAAGMLADWDVSDRIHEITVPTLVTVAKYDTMDPKYMAWMAEEIPHARALDLPEGSHLALYDDRDRYAAGIVKFLNDVDQGTFDE